MKGILLTVLALSGCTSMSSQWLAAEDSYGNVSRVLHVHGAGCPQAISAAADTDGCYYSGPVVFTAGGEGTGEGAETLAHELAHHRGGRHGTWMPHGGERCALILAQGRTDWVPGMLLCRGERGYYQRKP